MDVAIKLKMIPTPGLRDIFVCISLRLESICNGAARIVSKVLENMLVSDWTVCSHSMCDVRRSLPFHSVWFAANVSRQDSVMLMFVHTIWSAGFLRQEYS